VNTLAFKLAFAFSERILAEDLGIAEAMQRSAGLGFSDGLLGAQEERIGWFNTAYLSSLQEPGRPSETDGPTADLPLRSEPPGGPEETALRRVAAPAHAAALP
jgi:hypothetical protein